MLWTAPPTGGCCRIQLAALREQIRTFDNRILGRQQTKEIAKRLVAIPGVDLALATAPVASVADTRVSRSGLDFFSLGRAGAETELEWRPVRLGSVSKQGNRYLKSVFAAGALSVITYAKRHRSGHRPLLAKLLERRLTKVAAVALVNKLAMMASGEEYREPVALAR